MGGAAGGGASLLARSRPAGVGLGGFFDTTGGAVGGGVGCFSSAAVGPALSSSFLSGSGCSVVSPVIIDRAATSDSSALFCFLFCSSACHGLRPGSSSFGFGGGGFAFGFAFGGGALLTSGVVAAAAAGCCTDGCDGGGGCEGGGGGGGSDKGCVVRVAVFLSGIGGGPPALTFGFCWTGGVAAACSDTGAVGVVAAATSCLGDSSS